MGELTEGTVPEKSFQDALACHSKEKSSKFLRMATANANVISIARLSEKGQLTIPAEYRREHDLERDSTLALITLGDALVLAPIDEVLARITERMEAAMRGAGVAIEDLVEETLTARAEIVREEFGEVS